ncbi:MAG: peroxidase family protein, partial [Hyphomonadaceae bacterium]
MVTFIRSDLEFILEQIRIAERHAAGEDLRDILPNVVVPWGLRTVSGAYNNLVTGNESTFGAADNLFPRLAEAEWRVGESLSIDTNGPAPGGVIVIPAASYDSSGLVVDSQPRIISNLIVDQTASNPAAVAANGGADPVLSPGPDGVFNTPDDVETFFIPNVTPDAGLGLPFNAWMTFFGQFFDHGLDLVTKGGNEIVLMPLQEDDPLYVPGSPTNFLVVTRATQTITPGADGILGTADDGRESTNTTSPFVDQNQTYSSHPSHQVFLREYELRQVTDAFGTRLVPFATGELIQGANGGMATWAEVKAQARDILGIDLTDASVFDVPLLLTDEYGNFIPDPLGMPQVVMTGGTLVSGNLAAPISLANAISTGHSFLDDIAHSADPSAFDPDGPFGPAPSTPRVADDDNVIGDDGDETTYDDELLGAHYIAGDGRVNENIGLTAVHHVFHAEHNRLVQHTKDVALASGDVAFLNEWLLVDVTEMPDTPAELAALVWDGERLFQAAKFGTEMQYQHLVFEEFSRTIQPQIDAFLAPNGYDTTIDPSIVAEFAHTVYRFGHSMLTETIDRFTADFELVGATTEQMGLVESFLNPLAFAASGATPEEAAGAIIRGLTRQQGNEIDEFVTEALRNNLLGLPLDLAAINIARGRDTGVPSLNNARAQFYAMTGDAQLKPYTSWADFAAHLKHPESLINFIAAYGTHQSILDATDTAGKRAAATLLVLGGVGEPADRLDFLWATGAYAGGSLGGLNAVDFWIGGLAEKQAPFGGLLGSTFNFVFETQLESLQDADRFYYLSRTAGMHFGGELEQNSFSKMIMAHTDLIHLPDVVFQTPAYTLEVDQSRQFTGLGPDGRADPEGGILVHGTMVRAEVERDDPTTAGADANYLRYNGVEHVVIGGTAGDDVIVSSEGDDTLWGDEGNDKLEGGYGNDTILGGDGDDIISDIGGDDVIKGGDGNDVIHGGAMEAGGAGNLIFGGFGKDFIITQEDIATSFGSAGDDFIYSAKTAIAPTGNEGDDWIEWGTQDGAPGDNFNPTLGDDIAGNDIFIGGPGFDEPIGEGGDDIFTGSDAEDKIAGMSGYDWVTFNRDIYGVTADLTRTILGGIGELGDHIALGFAASPTSVLDQYEEVEGLSGSDWTDYLIGDDVDAVTILNHGGAAGSALTNLDLIDGLRQLFEDADLSTTLVPGQSLIGGNIILGGGSGDFIQGNGGDDLIHGDRELNVRISIRDPNNPEVEWGTADSMIGEVTARPGAPAYINGPLHMLMINGLVNPGQLQAVREIVDGADGYDTAIFRGPLFVDDGNGGQVANYTIAVNGVVVDPLGPINISDTDIVTVTDLTGTDGVDTLLSVERLQFSDVTVRLQAGNSAPVGAPEINNLTPTEGDLLTVSLDNIVDPDNAGPITGQIAVTWQVELDPGSGIFEDITDIPAGGGTFISANGLSFRVGPDYSGLALRVKAIYVDDEGVPEIVFSAPTAPVIDVPDAPPAEPEPVLELSGTGDAISLARSDLVFILDQIKIAEEHAAGTDLLSLVPNLRTAAGLRTVTGEFNNLINLNGINNTHFGAADNVFPRATTPVFNTAEDIPAGFFGPGSPATPTSYAQTSGIVFDSQPRTISNLLVDQTPANPAAVAAALRLAGVEDPGGLALQISSLFVTANASSAAASAASAALPSLVAAAVATSAAASAAAATANAAQGAADAAANDDALAAAAQLLAAAAAADDAAAAAAQAVAAQAAADDEAAAAADALADQAELDDANAANAQAAALLAQQQEDDALVVLNAAQAALDALLTDGTPDDEQTVEIEAATTERDLRQDEYDGAVAASALADDAATVAQAIADATDAVVLRADADAAQATADATDASALQVLADDAQALADLTDALALQAAADSAQATADATDAGALQSAADAAAALAQTAADAAAAAQQAVDDAQAVIAAGESAQLAFDDAVTAAGIADYLTSSPGLDGAFGTADDHTVFLLPNTTPDAGLSAPFNAWMTFFGQFFDHGLDLVSKGGSGTVFIPLQPDDPLYVPGSPTNFMVLTRATNQPGEDGILGTADDIHEHSNTTSPFVDQNQTYSSHPSHQVFLRHYNVTPNGPVSSGLLLTNHEINPDGSLGADLGGMSTWAVLKAQAASVLGIQLTDADIFHVPLLATDDYGNFIPGENGFVQIVTTTGLVEANPADNGGLGTLLPANTVFTGHAFLDDIAHNATPTAGLISDDDSAPGLASGVFALANASFEADSLADGEPGVNVDPNGNYTLTPPTGWSMTGTGGVYAPVDAITSNVSHTGAQVAWLTAGASMSQDTGVILREGGIYKLTVRLGDRTDQTFGGATVSLVTVDGDVIATIPVAAPTTEGGWRAVTLNTPAISAALAGEELRIVITNDGGGGGQVLVDNVALSVGVYDNELLDAHYMAGDGRVNENIGLTAVHHVFHSEHNRMIDQIKHTLISTSTNVTFLNEWLLTDLPANTVLPTDEAGIDALIDTLNWDGERLFQAAKFSTEMQYQHLVFEEFARTIHPNIDLFFAPTQVYDVNLDPSIVAEFAHVVYRFGHSMLTETVDRFDVDFNVIADPSSANPDQQLGLIAAFLNPLAYAASGTTPEEAAGAIVRGVTRTTGNAIDEFVTDALRSNLLGLPLDLAALNIARGRDTGVPSLNEVRRQIYNETGESMLKPYASWSEFLTFIKHPESIVNFIAAYGTHVAITSAVTMAAKREAALLLVLGDGTDGDGVTIGANTYTDRLDFLNSTGAWASAANGATTTGLDDVDLWIGGLAEEVMPFGGMLGSTFTFIFENQLEALQDADRFYYLERTAGLNFVAALEGNTFAKMIMANTDATHLPALVFSTPAFTLEVDQSRQHTGLGLTGNDDPVNDDPSILTPLVIRDNPDTAGPDTNYLRYTGADHVVLGGTSADDIIVSSEGDDTLWGDAGNDRLDGGHGNDTINGGRGDDIITDVGGDDVIQGDDGNDVIHGGAGVNLIIAGYGNDFIVTGEDANESFGGQGNDFIYGTKADEQNMGGEGDDWLQFGTTDGGPGDNFDPLGNDPIRGNDVYIGAGEADKFNAEGGDDIMVGSSGFGNRYIGASGFDWANFKNSPDQGVYIDMSGRFFDQPRVPGSDQSILARFDAVEGLSGSHHGDVLVGTDVDAAAIVNEGAYGSVLTNISLIDGLQQLLNQALGGTPTFFDGGNIILGGSGSDIMQGRGGDDIIHGDNWLNVRISVRANTDGTGPEIDSFDSMDGTSTLNPADLDTLIVKMVSGEYNPGQLVIVREILDGDNDFDTAVFRGSISEYTVEVNGVQVDLNGPLNIEDGDVVTVTDTVAGRDGVDQLINVERLNFLDASVTLYGDNNSPEGNVVLINHPLFISPPRAGVAATVDLSGVTDADNPGGVIGSPVAIFWQIEVAPGVFEDILVEGTGAAAGEMLRVSGPSFTPGDGDVGLALRVRAIYQDAAGNMEEVFSAPSAPIAAFAVNSVATGLALIDSALPVEGDTLNASAVGVADANGLTAAVFTFQWQSSSDGVTWTDIAGATLASFTPEPGQVGQQIRVLISFVDDAQFTETLTSDPTAPVAPANQPAQGAPTILGTVIREGELLSASALGIIDNDGLSAPGFFYIWEVSHDGGTTWDFAGIGEEFTPTQLEVGGILRVSAAFTDDLGFGEFLVSASTTTVGDLFNGDGTSELFDGTDGSDLANGNGGNDTLNGLAGDDILNGGAGGDTLNGGDGADVLD